MQKKNKLLLTFVVILILYQLFFSILKAEHKSVYKIVKNKDTYIIDENYYRSENRDYYYVNVNFRDYNYIFTLDNEFFKSRNIVKDVLRYELKSATCMVLELTNDEYSEPMCIMNDTLYSYLAVKDEIGTDELDTYFYNRSYNDEMIRTIEDGKIVANKNHFDEGEYVAIYNGKEILIFTYDGVKKFTFGTVDSYKNYYGKMVDKYYVVPKIDDGPDFNEYIVYDVENNTSKSIKLKFNMPKSSFVNGAFDKKMYIVDKSNVIQYRLDPVELTVDRLAKGKEDAYSYATGAEERVSIYSLIDEETEFNERVDTEFTKLDFEKISQNGIYAYYYKKGVFYKVYKDYLDTPICLFTIDDPKNVVMTKDNIYFIEGTTIMKYNSHGLNDLVEYKEFEHNNYHIFDVYMK